MTKHFLITAAAAVTYFARANQANAAKGEGDFVISKQDDLLNVPGPLMVSVYNDAAVKGEGKTITKFSDKVSAAKRVWPTLDFLAKEGKVPEGAAKPARATRERKEGAGQRGRTSSFAGMKIRKLADGNPRREGSFGHASYEVMRTGMTFETFIANGGRLKDLAWDVAAGHVEMYND